MDRTKITKTVKIRNKVILWESIKFNTDTLKPLSPHTGHSEQHGNSRNYTKEMDVAISVLFSALCFYFT